MRQTKRALVLPRAVTQTRTKDQVEGCLQSAVNSLLAVMKFYKDNPNERLTENGYTNLAAIERRALWIRQKVAVRAVLAPEEKE